jgi:hydrogenase maturation factor
VSGTCDGPVCLTCSDQADRLIVLATDGVEAEVADGAGQRSRVDVSLVDPLRPGDEVLVHAGVAIAAIDPAADGRVATGGGVEAREGTA